MKLDQRVIYKGKIPEYIVLPIKRYEDMRNKIEEYEDIAEIRRQRVADEECFPAELVYALAGGANPILIYREYRGLSQTDLAAMTEVSEEYLQQLEAGERKGSPKILKAIAKALKLDFDDLVG